MPKIPNCEVFYKRLLWFFIFNVHVYFPKESYFFYSLEGSFMKGGNSVCSYIYEVLKESIFKYKNVKEIVLLSDATAAQNRNNFVLKFCLFLSIKFNINIVQIFPVKGHSFCICDSNFSVFSREVKNIEVIENPEDYINILKALKNFKLLYCDVFDYEKFLSSHFKKLANISKAVKIEYFSNGNINLYDNYNEILKSENLVKSSLKLIKKLNIIDVPLAPTVGVNIKKKDDVLSLCNYLKPINRKYYEDYFKNVISNNSNETNVIDSEFDCDY